MRQQPLVFRIFIINDIVKLSRFTPAYELYNGVYHEKKIGHEKATQFILGSFFIDGA